MNEMVRDRVLGGSRPLPGLGAPQAVFLHGMWRSGSTYVWSRFRQAEGVCCFYEPLHPGLGRLTRRRIPRDTPDKVSANRHPALDRPYFAEYEPLIGVRGVRRFRRDMVFDRFALRSSEDNEPLRRYLAGLTDHAAGQGRMGVLGFNQSGLRIGWLRSQFDSFDVHVEREPRDIWSSYMEHRARNNFTYFRMWLQVLEANAADPLFAPLAERMPIRRGAARWLPKPKLHYARVVPLMSDEDLYLLVTYMWIGCAMHALSECELIIDTGLSSRPGYRQALARKVAAGSGLRVSFMDLKATPAASQASGDWMDRVEASALRLFPMRALVGHCEPGRVRRRLGEIEPRKAELLAQLV